MAVEKIRVHGDLKIWRVLKMRLLSIFVNDDEFGFLIAACMRRNKMAKLSLKVEDSDLGHYKIYIERYKEKLLK